MKKPCLNFHCLEPQKTLELNWLWYSFRNPRFINVLVGIAYNNLKRLASIKDASRFFVSPVKQSNYHFVVRVIRVLQHEPVDLFRSTHRRRVWRQTHTPSDRTRRGTYRVVLNTFLSDAECLIGLEAMHLPSLRSVQEGHCSNPSRIRVVYPGKDRDHTHKTSSDDSCSRSRRKQKNSP